MARRASDRLPSGLTASGAAAQAAAPLDRGRREPRPGMVGPWRRVSLRTILIAAAVALVPIAPAGAVFLNGSTLHNWCLSKEIGDQEACLGYVVGVADALDTAPENEAAGVVRRRLCLPELEAKTAVDAVKQYLLVHPPTGDGGTGADLVADALADAYPCP
jgi:hypothetical protein